MPPASSSADHFVARSAVARRADRRHDGQTGELIAGLVAVALFLLDDTAGGRVVSVLMVASTLVSLVLRFAPDGWTHVGRATPPIIGRG